jgi:hypothetical protein
MSANTRFFVEYYRRVKDVVEVSAVTEDEAWDIASDTAGIPKSDIIAVKHWSEYEGM